MFCSHWKTGTSPSAPALLSFPPSSDHYYSPFLWMFTCEYRNIQNERCFQVVSETGWANHWLKEILQDCFACSIQNISTPSAGSDRLTGGGPLLHIDFFHFTSCWSELTEKQKSPQVTAPFPNKSESFCHNITVWKSELQMVAVLRSISGV